MTDMAEFVSEDVLDWARDLAAMRRLLAGERLEPAPRRANPSPPLSERAERAVPAFGFPQRRDHLVIAEKSVPDLGLAAV
jgi:hypothetical protein